MNDKETVMGGTYNERGFRSEYKTPDEIISFQQRQRQAIKLLEIITDRLKRNYYDQIANVKDALVSLLSESLRESRK